MVRKLASVLVSLAVMSPAWVQALGLGGIELNSFLNQPLDAQIEIISSKRGEADGMRVNLASPDAFARAGLEYSNTLRQLKFTVVTKPNGKQYIKVTTRKGYREPFLNFLLEVNWANGRILREYAELVDPPTLVQSTRTTTAVAPVSRPVTPATSTQQPKAPTYTTTATAGTSGFIGDTYTTKRNDTAWKIANNARPDDQVTVEQSMMALLRANPDAFIKQNINRLKAGYTLNIPDRDSMLSQSHADALAEVRRQTREWRGRRTAAAAPKGRLEILPPQAEAGTDSQAGSAGPGTATEAHREAMLAREAAEAQRQENAELRLRVSELEEQIANSKRLAELKADQLAALEKKLAEINAARDTAPAAAVTEPDTASVAEEAVSEPETAVAEVPPEDVAPEAPEAAAVTEPARAPSQVVDAVPAKPGTPINQHVVSGFEPVEIDKLPTSELPAKPFKTGEVSAPDAAAEAGVGIIDRVFAYFKQNPIVKWVVAGAGGLLVLILGMLMLRRGQGGQQFEESILQEQPIEEPGLVQESTVASEAESSEELFETVRIDEPAPEATKEMSDSSFLSDMVLSDMSDLQGEGAESDPLTEADVFLAYGRFGPAENMIKGAIAKEPERHDLKLKLLEIYYSSKNKEAFEEEAAALHTDLENNPDPETWEKVVEMGDDLCPGNNLFAGAAAAVAATSAAEAIGDEEDTEIMDFDLGEFEDKVDSDTDISSIEKAVKEESLDLDLDEMLAATEPEEELDDTLEFTSELEGLQDAEPESTYEETTEITTELEGVDLEEPGVENPEITRKIVADEAPVNDEITAELEGIADVLKADDTAEIEQPDITRKIAQDSEPLSDEITQELKIPDLDSAGGMEADDTAEIEQPDITRKIVQDAEPLSDEITQELKIPDLDNAGDMEVADTTLRMDEDIDLDDDVLADIDEVGTKLDLARAYIDMGDPEGARSILDEVVEEGNDSQKSEAEKLLSQI